MTGKKITYLILTGLVAFNLSATAFAIVTDDVPIDGGASPAPAPTAPAPSPTPSPVPRVAPVDDAAENPNAPAPAAPQKYDPNYKLIVPIPGFSPQGTINPLDYLKAIYNFAIGLGLLVAVATIVFAGLKWATSAGNVSATSEAKDMILNAVYGVVMLLGAVLILTTISPSLTTLKIPALAPVGSGGFDFGSYSSSFGSYKPTLNDLKKVDANLDQAQNDATAANEIALAADKAYADYKGTDPKEKQRLKVAALAAIEQYRLAQYNADKANAAKQYEYELAQKGQTEDPELKKQLDGYIQASYKTYTDAKAEREQAEAELAAMK